MANVSIANNPTQAPLNAKTQRARILRLLIEACGAWVPLPEIMACAAQYNARILELRRDGFNIPKPRVEVINGQKHTWYRLLPSPAPASNSSFSAEKPPKSWEQVCAERDEKMRQTAEPPFELVP
jgi:hypothetical protein